ncbi:MAG: hypothetical protein E7454_00050 [Ruminococcaceae bacterium]|nr:hypothetical protein [Oscillospiraceae bacterium]
MISCTEFILSYNELFAFLDRKYGRAEVDQLWDFLFKPTGKGIPLINFVRKDGVKGCVDYWTGTLTEESSEVTFIYNLEEGWFIKNMHRCPSKGRLLEFKETLGIEPYPHYCDHCDYYRSALEAEGLTWIRNHLDVDKAGCNSVIWDTKKFKGVMHMDKNTVVKEFHAADHEYFHPDFHSSMNMGIEYLGQFHGEADVREYLEIFTRNVYKPVLEKIKENPFDAISEKIRSTYIAEKAEDALEILQDDNSLTVKIAYCPGVKHLRKTGRDVSEWFSMTTTVVMEALAKAGDLDFKMEHYDVDTGAAQYRFTKK